jgi:hypothetical protein
MGEARRWCLKCKSPPTAEQADIRKRGESAKQIKASQNKNRRRRRLLEKATAPGLLGSVRGRWGRWVVFMMNLGEEFDFEVVHSTYYFNEIETSSTRGNLLI